MGNSDEGNNIMLSTEGEVVSVVALGKVFVEAQALAMNKFRKNSGNLNCSLIVIVEVQDEIGDKYGLNVGQLAELEKVVHVAMKVYEESLQEENQELAFVIQVIESRTPNDERPRSTDFKRGSVILPNGKKAQKSLLKKALGLVQEKRSGLPRKLLPEEKLFDDFVRSRVERVYPGLKHINLSFLDEKLVYQDEEVPKHRIKRIVEKIIKERKAARRKRMVA